MSRLTIISHTEHYKDAEGHIVGLGSTVTEINNLLDIFDEIYHVAMFHEGVATNNTLAYQSERIKFIPIPAVGGNTLIDKLNIIWRAPSILNTVRKALKKADYFQFRSPTGIGVFIIPYLICFNSTKGWFKYAGNWKQNKPPLSYAFQQWLLKKQKQRPVTINGSWPDQLQHCLTFENPCLSNSEIQKGEMIRIEKSLSNTLINFCFVGRLEEEKGLSLLIEAFNNLEPSEKLMINNVHIVGQGKDKAIYMKLAESGSVNFIFHGYLSRAGVQEIYEKSHAIVLPSASEGFPKVIAEAMNFGCLPIVSNVSSIGHYVKDGINGFLLDAVSEVSLIDVLRKMLKLTDLDYCKMLRSNEDQLDQFTYSYYNARIKKLILNS